MLNHTCNFKSFTKIYDFFFLSVAIFKSQLLKMAVTVMTVKFGTIQHSSLAENFEACFTQLFGQIQRATKTN